jgi:HEAT repeat protein
VLKTMGAAAAPVAGDLADLLTDDDPNIRLHACEVLVVMGVAAKDALPACVDVLKTETHDSDMRQRAAQVLGALGKEGASAVEALKKAATGPDLAVKAAAEAALKSIESAQKAAEMPK